MKQDVSDSTGTLPRSNFQEGARISLRTSRENQRKRQAPEREAATEGSWTGTARSPWRMASTVPHSRPRLQRELQARGFKTWTLDSRLYHLESAWAICSEVVTKLF